jgi:site-specific DNA recombinase
MLEAAGSGRFDVLVVTDLTRLSRSQGDLAKVIDRLTAKGIRILGAQDGYDNARKGHKLQAGRSGIIGEAFREMISERTYTALQSRAQQGRPAGGKRYGYGDGEREVVRQIFHWYADGSSPQWIAAERNRRAIPSPGTAWNRMTRRRGGWQASAIAGDAKRGIGVLNNESYIGRIVWNRSRWIKDPDTGKRRCILRPLSEWIVYANESARIVPQELWERVKARQARRAATAGEKITRGLKGAGGHSPRYMFSGLMRCDACGSSFVMQDKYSYQ